MGGSGLSVIITQAHDDRLCVLHHFRYVDYLLAFLSLNADPHMPPVMHSPQRIIKALRHSPRGLTSFQVSYSDDRLHPPCPPFPFPRVRAGGLY